MNKCKLKEKIEALEKELNKLKQELSKPDACKVWVPEEYDEYYWFIEDTGSIDYCYNKNNETQKMIDYGNYFKTKEEAIKQAEWNRVMNKFRKYVEAYSEPLDWEDEEQKKYSIQFVNGYIEMWYEKSLCEAFVIYASSEQILKDAIIYSAGSEDEFKRIVFGVEE